jgi:hypothetical protein
LATAGAAPVAVLAAAMDGEKIDRLAIDDGDFRFADIKSWRDPDFLPGAIKYGDLPAFLALSNAGQIWVATQDKKSADASMVAYRNLKGKPTFVASQKAVGDAVDWITH